MSIGQQDNLMWFSMQVTDIKSQGTKDAIGDAHPMSIIYYMLLLVDQESANYLILQNGSEFQNTKHSKISL